MSTLDLLLGRPLASSEEEEQKIGVASGVAVLGLDGLSSAAYGPEAALTLLLPLGALGLYYIGPIILAILALLTVLYFSYRQTIAAYPGGGGSYTVARENLGTNAGLLAAAALLLDYVLNVAVGISAGVGALVSAVPSLHGHTLSLCLVILGLIALVNLRGARESGLVFGLPTLLFVVTLFVTIGVGVVKTVMAGGHPAPIIAPPALPAATAGVGLWLVLRAFASGCTAMTGVEAVSNGVSAFAKPAARHAQACLTAIVGILALLLAGVAFLSRAYGIGATDPDSPAYQSVLSMLIEAVMGRGLFYYVTIGSVLSVLALSANTSFADFPRLCRLLASDDFLPHAFANRSRRLVYSIGIGILTALAALLLIAFGGITDRLIPLFAIGAFGAFVLSQAGMVVHWRKIAQANSKAAPGAGVALLVNAVGCVATAIALAIILAAKFAEGAWVTLLLLPVLFLLFRRTQAHYQMVARQTALSGPLDVSHIHPPVVVVPMKSWNRITERGVRFALNLSPDVLVVHIQTDAAEGQALTDLWETEVARPTREAHLPQPRLILLDSPYRRLFTPLLRYVTHLKDEYPDRQIAVIIPELVEKRWSDYLLHNQRATGLKAALLLRGDSRVVVINVPWYL